MSLTYLTPLKNASFSPPNIAGLQLWLDAQKTSSLTQSGGAVSLWADRSTNAYTFTQPTGANQPTVDASTLNGFQSLKFTGANNSYMWLSLVGSGGGVSCISSTVFCVYQKFGSITNNAILFEGNNGSMPGTENGGPLGDYSTVLEIYDSVATFQDFTITTGTSPHIITIQPGTGPASSTMSANNVALSKAGSAGTTYGAGLALGLLGSRGSSGVFATNIYLGEVLVYNSTLSAGDVSKVYSYLSAKWGI